MNSDLYTKLEIHRLPAELRGHAVARDIAEKSVGKFFGHLSSPTFISTAP